MYPYDLEISSDHFLGMDNVTDLARLLHVPAGMLIDSSLYPVYTTFRIPKKAGGYRLIEAPEKQLKSKQKTIAIYLQAVYMRIRPDSSHGFISKSPAGDTRNIISNAGVHVGKRFVLTPK